MKKRVLKHRFSLIELLVVCGLLMVLMGIGVGVYSLVQRKMNDLSKALQRKTAGTRLLPISSSA